MDQGPGCDGRGPTLEAILEAETVSHWLAAAMLLLRARVLRLRRGMTVRQPQRQRQRRTQKRTREGIGSGSCRRLLQLVRLKLATLAMQRDAKLRPKSGCDSAMQRARRLCQLKLAS